MASHADDYQPTKELADDHRPGLSPRVVVVVLVYIAVVLLGLTIWFSFEAKPASHVTQILIYTGLTGAIGGSGERKTLRLVAQYAQACNLFPGPQLPHKLDVLRAHCEAVGRDYDEISKTVIYRFDVGKRGERAAELVEQLGAFAELGISMAIGGVAGVWSLKPLEIMGSEVIPAVAGL